MKYIGAGPGIYPMNGGGGEGTSNYNDLQNKPTLNGVTIEGNKTSEDYGIGSENKKKILATKKKIVKFLTNASLPITKSRYIASDLLPRNTKKKNKMKAIYL